METSEELIIKDQLYTFLRKSPEYALKKGYFREIPCEKGKAYAITAKAWRELKDVIVHKQKKSALFKKLQNLKNRVNLFEFVELKRSIS